MIKAVFAGSFDPPTFGHLNVIQRASEIFDSIDVVIAVNKDKKYFFSDTERFDMMNALIKSYKNVQVHLWNGLIVNYAKNVGAKVLVRGVRGVNDFNYEFDLALMNQSLDNEIETMFIPTREEYAIVKSSSIKELAKMGGDISRMVPSIVKDRLLEKLNGHS